MKRRMLFGLLAAVMLLALVGCGAAEKEKPAMIETTIQSFRDPFVLADDGSYYMYGTGWFCYKNTSGQLDGPWQTVGKIVRDPEEFAGDRWAPEVYKYNDAYYMFTTYESSKGGKRGCAVLRASSPTSFFTEVSDGIITPPDDSSIDGTLYIDPQGDPWMVYVDEWIDNEDLVGRMMAARMSEDLTKLISEPIELFRADDAPWARDGITDGCFMHTLSDGQLLMLWSNFDEAGYCVGIARSRSGKLDGQWEQDEMPLFSKQYGKYDGGHPMLLTDNDGQLWMVLHAPNKPEGDRTETPVFIPMEERDGTLVCVDWQ